MLAALTRSWKAAGSWQGGHRKPRTDRTLQKHGWACGAWALVVVVLVGCAPPGTIGGSGRLPSPPPAVTPTALPPAQFPQDEAPHHDLTEWWYYTGHLHGTDAQGRAHAYGFELTIFQILRGQFPPYYAAHFAVSDLTRGQFHFDQRTQVGSPSAIPAAGSRDGFDLAVSGWRMQGLAGVDHLTADMPGYTIALTLTGVKPAVLHGGTGLITYGLGGFSYYYSRPRMAVTGTISDHGAAIPVGGTAWMDHQWGNFVPLAGFGWDWFSIQLENNTEYMFYVIRDAQKRPVSTVGTYVGQDGAACEVASAAITTRALGTWTSPVTGGVYPSGWTVTVEPQRLTLTLRPDLQDQELVAAQSTGTAYWEGAVSVTGSVAGHAVKGQGYVELTGYAAVPAGTPGPALP